MQPPFDIAADLDTPVSAFMKLESFQPRFLLESVEGGERLARYSFIGFGDAVTYRLDSDGLRIDGQVRERPATQDHLLDTLRETLSRAPHPGKGLSGLPLQGGLVGIAGYDMVRYFESLPRKAEAVPGHPEAAFVAPRSMLVFDHLTRRVALLHDGEEAERERLKKDVIRALRGPLPDQGGSGRHLAPKTSFSAEEFCEAVEKAKDHIRQGDVYQLVLSVQFSGECSIPPFEVYRALRCLNPSPYLFYLDFDGIAVVGSSPEALVKLEGREAFLRPIAGTRPRGVDVEQDEANEKELLADPKEAAEHVMLVDLARNDLGRVGLAGTVRVDPYRTIERYSHVMHIVSGVRGVLDPKSDAMDLFAATFPAGTVVGAPKVRAMELIEELEPVRRGIYAGTAGYFAAGGSMDQAITIRTLAFHDGKYFYQAGAGIVADSIAEKEFEEVMAKSEVLRSALRLAEEGL